MVKAEKRADQILIDKTIEGMKRLYPGFDRDKGLQERTDYELETIISMGFTDYFLIVQDFLDIARKAGHMPEERLVALKGKMDKMSPEEMTAYIEADMSMPGMTVGLGRGSAAGSVVAYALGITSIDPIANGLLFERFLNPERVSMPDVDSDFSKSEFPYGVRDIAVAYVTVKYGKDGVCGITTPGTMAPKAAVKDVARVMGDKKAFELYGPNPKEHAVDRKKVAKEYMNIGDKIASFIPNDPKASFKKPIGKDQPLLSEFLEEKFSGKKIETEIIRMAGLLEGVNKQYGKHACGIVIADNGDVGEYAPLMWDVKDGSWKIQLDGEWVEKAGFLKMDFLGLKNLNIITMAVRDIYKNHGEYVEPLSLPQDADVYAKVFSKGLTNAVFQFESSGMKKMLQQFKPSSFEDITLLVACYRPGPMQYLDGIIARKHGRAAEENAVTRIAGYHEGFKKIVEPTYLAPVYQEQVMQIFRLAGYSMGGADNVRRAMGKKKLEKLEVERPKFIEGAVNVGIKKQDAEELFEELIDFASYAFNKSHAAAYAMTAYITAWLKLRYPTEFYAAVLNCNKIEKFPPLIAEAKSFGVVIKGPDVNVSEPEFSGRNGIIYFGLSGIKGMGKDAGLVKKGHSSIADFIMESKLDSKKITALARTGAFDRFCPNRTALLRRIPVFLKHVKPIKSARKKLAVEEAKLKDLKDGVDIRSKYKITTKSLPTQASLEKKISELKEKLREQEDSMRGEIIPAKWVKDDLEQKLADEKELLGMYVSGHPLDAYGKAEDHGAVSISSAKVGEYSNVFGMVTQFRDTVSRKDSNSHLAFFTIEDADGASIECAMFSKSYDANSETVRLLAEECAGGGTPAVVVKGRKQLKNQPERSGAEDEDEEEEIFQIILNNQEGSIRVAEKKLSRYTVRVQGIEEYATVLEKLAPYKDENGHEVCFYNEAESRPESIMGKPLRVSEKALELEFVTE